MAAPEPTDSQRAKLAGMLRQASSGQAEWLHKLVLAAGYGKTPAKPRPGRPLLLQNEQVRERLLRAVSLGMTWEDAAQAAGVDASSLYRWRAEGAAANKKSARGEQLTDREAATREFCETLKTAQADGMFAMLENIHRAGEQNWTAHAWILERRHSNLFARLAPEDEIKRRAVEYMKEPVQRVTDFIHYDLALDAEQKEKLVARLNGLAGLPPEQQPQNGPIPAPIVAPNAPGTAPQPQPAASPTP
ncbi:MAG: helix-turn-helix domain-containing protein [Planctomycetota bacterium]